MLAKAIPNPTSGESGQGFSVQISYICIKACQITLCNLAGGWIHAAGQMDWIAQLNPRLSKPCYHLILSWSPLEAAP